MIKNYALEPMLYEECLSLIDECFPGIKCIADKGKLYNAHWDNVSTPFVYYINDELVGHLGLIPFKLVINNQDYTGAALHGICVKEKFRRKGIFTELMNEALLHIQRNYSLSFLFTDQANIYEPFGFKRLDEYDFLVENLNISRSNHAIRKLDLDSASDLQIMHDLLLKRLPISNRFGMVKETVVFTLTALSAPIYYSDKNQLLISYDIKDDVLYVKDIVFTKLIDFQNVISCIPESYSKIILQFYPDNFKNLNFKPIKAAPEDFIMVSENFNLGALPLRYPETERC
jgi:predicted N-acetyltransferase YhbS